MKSTVFILTVLTMLSAVACKNKDNAAHVRDLPLEGAYNVRDMGGYETADGKTVKWGVVFRSGDLNHLTDKDLMYMSAIPLITTIDFRDSAEIAAAPDRKPSSLRNQFFLPIETGSIIVFQNITPELAPTLLVEGNKFFVDSCANQYKEFFRILQEQEQSPLLFHCSAGKDRAGFAAALFLSSLGVDRATVIEDYMLTNDALKDKYKAMTDSLAYLRPLMEARREYIEAALDEIDSKHGGMENYLTKVLGVDLDRMKKLYTE